MIIMRGFVDLVKFTERHAKIALDPLFGNIQETEHKKDFKTNKFTISRSSSEIHQHKVKSSRSCLLWMPS